MLKIGHEVIRPSKLMGGEDVTIPVPEELETVPGIPTNQREVDWYAREYPLETMNITERASRDWANKIRDGHAEMREIRKEHDKLNRNLVMAARLTGDVEPTAEPSGQDVSEAIKEKARELLSSRAETKLSVDVKASFTRPLAGLGVCLWPWPSFPRV